MPDLDHVKDIVKCLEDRTDKLIHQYQSSLNIIERQKSKIEDLDSKLQEEREKGRLLKDRLDSVLLANAIGRKDIDAGNKEKATARIDKLVREIEKCIALLNK